MRKFEVRSRAIGEKGINFFFSLMTLLLSFTFLLAYLIVGNLMLALIFLLYLVFTLLLLIGISRVGLLIDKLMHIQCSNLRFHCSVREIISYPISSAMYSSWSSAFRSASSECSSDFKLRKFASFFSSSSSILPFAFTHCLRIALASIRAKLSPFIAH